MRWKVRRGNVRCPALVLPVMLVVLALLAILSASFAFQVNAHRAGVHAVKNSTQLRMAAESGIQHALLLLRENRHDASLWYDNEELFHNQVVWSVLGDEAERDPEEDIDARSTTFRYSLVADDPEEDTAAVRYGITDEGGKLNLNIATVKQLTTLFTEVLPPDTEIAPLVEAVIDWRDADDTPGEQGAEFDYYESLETPYAIKNGFFETVEELLLVRGFHAMLLFGEDYNRNGILDPNEDDGEAGFPVDNQDGILDRGIYPYLTVWSRDLNRSNDNQPRINLNGEIRKLKEELEAVEFDEAVIEYIIAARNNGESFTSPVQLLGHSYRPGGGRGGGNPQAGDRGAGEQNGEDDAGDAEDGDADAELDPDGAPADESGGEDDPASAEDDGPVVESPVTLDDLPVLCDLTTAINQPGLMGQLNVNTAPRQVLYCLVNDTFTREDADAIVAFRGTLTGEQMTTPAWLLTEGVVSQEAVESIYPLITTRGQQFHIEAIGHADHLGMMSRLQAVVELRGHVPQFMYYRDVTRLGTYPIRGTREGDEVVRSRRR